MEEKKLLLFECGCSEYIVKPFQKEDILFKIQRYLNLEGTADIIEETSDDFHEIHITN